jgi:hypothetical protein
MLIPAPKGLVIYTRAGLKINRVGEKDTPQDRALFRR